MSYIHADSAFVPGRAHLTEGSPCQDYAVAGLSPLVYGIIADGCSTSGRTDVGARLIALAARSTLDDWQSNIFPGDTLENTAFLSLARAREAGRLLSLDITDFDATLGLVVAGPDQPPTACLFGDGLIVSRTGDDIEVRIVDWAGNMPGYPNYLLDRARRRDFIGQSEAFAADAGRAACIVETWSVPAGGGPATLRDREEWSAQDALHGHSISWHANLPDVVAVLSDGAQQVDGRDWETVIRDTTAFKAARAGAFVTRRVRRALATWRKDGHEPVDDFSIAAIAQDASSL